MLLKNSLAIVADPPGFWRNNSSIDLNPEFESWLSENNIKYKLKIKGIPEEYYMSYRVDIKFKSLSDKTAFKMRWL